MKLARIPVLAIFLSLACCEDGHKDRAGSAPPVVNSLKVSAKAGAGLTAASREAAAKIAPLIDPEKLATLGKRQGNPRVQKAVAILWDVKREGGDPAAAAGEAVRLIGWRDTAKGSLTSEALLRNLTILERLGATTPQDIDRMHHGHAPVVGKGPYAGDTVSVDHIVPRAVCPELDNVIANLELMPLRVNQSKNDKIGDRQRDLAGKLQAAGLLADPSKIR